MLFFNPAVWWISHQVRLEREACCDATAASLLASPLGYAEVLLAWVERVRRADMQVDDTVIPGVAFGTAPGPLVDRIERLVSPGYRPMQRVSLKTCLLIASMAIAGYLLLQRGSDLAVMVAGQLLSDQQRVDRLVEVRREVGAEAASKPGTYTLTGTVRTIDDQPLRTVSVTLRTLSPGTNRSVGRSFSEGNFQFEAQTGKSWIGVHVEGCAPFIRGPFSGEAGTTVALEEIELKRGFDAAVRVNDTRGAPIEGAQLRLSATIDGQSMLSLQPAITEMAGTAVLQNLSDHAFRIYVEADGFQPLIAEPLTFAPDEERVLVMQSARPTSGIVLTEQGVPAAGIELWRSRESRPGVQDLTHRKFTVSDAEGRFSLTQLRDDSIYTIYLVHQDRVAAVIDDVEAGDGDLQWRLTPPLTVRGRVTGLPSAEDEDVDKPELALFYMNRVGHRPETRVGNPRTRQQVMLDKEGAFTIENLGPGSLVLEIGSRRFSHELIDSQDDLVLDLSGPEPKNLKREVHITFRSPTGPAPIQGTSTFFTISQPGEQADEGKTESLEVQFDGPTLRIEAFAPGIISGSVGQVVGFWFEDPRIEIPAGEGPFETTIEVIPAGAITGRVLDAGGNPVTSSGVNVSCAMRHLPEPRKSMTRSLHNIRVNERGEFFLSPVILGAEALVSVTDGHNVQIVEPVMLTAATPTDEVTLRLTPVVDVAGVVLDEHGDPVPRLPFRLRFEQGPRNITFGSGWVTAHDGSFLIEGVSESVGQYFFEIDSRRDYVPLRQPLRRDGQPLEIQLQAGLAIVGVVTDQSGIPVPGVDVYARAVDWQQDMPPFFEAEGASDEEGRFRLSNLPDRMMQVHARQMHNVEDLQVRPGRRDLPPHVSLQGQVPDWHRERAEPPRP